MVHVRNIEFYNNKVVKYVNKKEANISKLVYPSNSNGLLLERPTEVKDGQRTGKWKLIMKKLIPATTQHLYKLKISNKALNMLKHQTKRLHNAGYAHKDIDPQHIVEFFYTNKMYYSLKRQLLLKIENNIVTEMYLTDFGISSKNKKAINNERIFINEFIEKLKLKNNNTPSSPMIFFGTPNRKRNNPNGTPNRTPNGTPNQNTIQINRCPAGPSKRRLY